MRTEKCYQDLLNYQFVQGMYDDTDEFFLIAA